jgi:hypothetical protein
MDIITTTHKYTPHATLEYSDREWATGWSVKVTWSCDTPGLLDRTDGGGWVLGNKATAVRLVAAVNAGVVFGTPELLTDVNGRTYVHAANGVHGRTANADLKRLGF